MTVYKIVQVLSARTAVSLIYVLDWSLRFYFLVFLLDLALIERYISSTRKSGLPHLQPPQSSPKAVGSAL